MSAATVGFGWNLETFVVTTPPQPAHLVHCLSLLDQWLHTAHLTRTYYHLQDSRQDTQ
jgi:hypothetical protein